MLKTAENFGKVVAIVGSVEMAEEIINTNVCYNIVREKAKPTAVWREREANNSVAYMFNNINSE